MRRRAAAGLAALLVVGATVGGPVAAEETGERFAMLADGAGGLWVLDGTAGQVARCRQPAEPSRVIDMVAGAPVPRERPGAVEPLCTGWVDLHLPAPAVRPKVLEPGG